MLLIMVTVIRVWRMVTCAQDWRDKERRREKGTEESSFCGYFRPLHWAPARICELCTVQDRKDTIFSREAPGERWNSVMETTGWCLKAYVAAQTISMSLQKASWRDDAIKRQI